MYVARGRLSPETQGSGASARTTTYMYDSASNVPFNTCGLGPVVNVRKRIVKGM
jgi:hypothetical protein